MATEIRTTIGALLEASAALHKLAALKLDAKARYHVVKLAKLIDAEVKTHFQDERERIMKELGVEREATPAERAQSPGVATVLEVPPTKLKELAEQLKALAAVDVTIPWGPVTSTMLESCLDFSGEDMLGLGPLFDLIDPEATNSPKI